MDVELKFTEKDVNMTILQKVLDEDACDYCIAITAIGTIYVNQEQLLTIGRMIDVYKANYIMDTEEDQKNSKKE